MRALLASARISFISQLESTLRIEASNHINLHGNKYIRTLLAQMKCELARYILLNLRGLLRYSLVVYNILDVSSHTSMTLNIWRAFHLNTMISSSPAYSRKKNIWTEIFGQKNNWHFNRLFLFTSTYPCCHHASSFLDYKSPSIPENQARDHADIILKQRMSIHLRIIPNRKQLHAMFSILDQMSTPYQQCKDQKETRTEVVNDGCGAVQQCKEDPLWPTMLTQSTGLNPFGAPIVRGDMYLKLKIHFDCLGWTWMTPLRQVQIQPWTFTHT